MRLPSRHSFNKGFTLIELLVVAPIALIAIATLVSLMIALVGDVAVSRERSVSSYDVQNALDRIEQDGRLATAFMPTFSLFVSPQGKNDSTGAFSDAGGDIIMSQYTTTANNYDSNRKIVYYADQPNPCTGDYTLNRPMTHRVIYFTKTVSGVTSLWRRTIVPNGSTTASGTTKLCDTPWQRNSCSEAFRSTGPCKTRDELMLDYVSTFTTTYYTSTGAVTTDERNADSLKVSLAQTKSVTGESVVTSGVARASHLNVTTDDIPTAPVISVYNPSINSYNNPILTTFAWDAVKNAAIYSVRYQINGGAWVNAPDQTETQFQVNSARPRDTITIRVAAKNDMGASVEKVFGYTTPQWTVANLEDDWECFQPTESSWPCPAYTLLDSNILVMRGMAKNGTSRMFILPSGLQPKKRLMFSTLTKSAAAAGTSIGRTDVATNGDVFLYGTSGDNGYVTLDSIRFIPSTVPTTWSVPTFYNGWDSWSAGTGSYGKMEYTSDGLGRTHLSGTLSVGTNTNGLQIHSLPTNYDEKGGVGIFPAVTNGYTIAPYSVNPGFIKARGLGSSFTSESTIYPNNTSTASFVSIAPQAGWTNYGGSYTTATYSKTSDGLVILQGLIEPTVTADGTILFTLPAGYRPAKQAMFGTADAGTGGATGQSYARIDVLSNGQVKIMYKATAGNWLSLEGISFYQEQ